MHYCGDMWPWVFDLGVMQGNTLPWFLLVKVRIFTMCHHYIYKSFKYGELTSSVAFHIGNIFGKGNNLVHISGVLHLERI